MIIAVDYDGTLEIGGAPNLQLVKQLKTRQRNGDIVILWTCREGKRLIEAVTKLRGIGFAPNYVNQNVPQMVARMGYDPRKIVADIYIDNKNA